jgi:anthranilate/para-aminobenzoate synthase component I
MVFARITAAPPAPVLLARALVARGTPGVALLHTSGAARAPLDLGRWSFVACEPDHASAALDPIADDPGFVPEAGALAFVPRWIGVLPYEGRRASLERATWLPPDARPPVDLVAPEWYRYPAVACVDHAEGRVLVAGSERAAVERLAALVNAAGPPFEREPAAPAEVIQDEPLARHAERVAAARELIARGDLYQVNLARRLGLHLRGGDPLALYARLARRAPAPFGCCLHLGREVAVVSTSPELLLAARTRPGALRFGSLFTAPIKGTRPRGADAASDAALARELDADPKERAELTMIVDVERNDLGRIAEAGSVRVVDGPKVVAHRTVHHRGALLAARARPDVRREEVLAAMVPSGSVTGAPKVRAMEVIASLEAARRGLYTGGIGFVGHDGAVTLSMAIRTAVLCGRDGDYWTGGGIVADSDPMREVEETRWKALQLMG